MTQEVRQKLLKYVVKQTSQTELLAQLAEEAAELGHAALKLRRVIDGASPTPTTFREAMDAFVEEVADVLLMINPEGDQSLAEKLRELQDIKLRRWADRLKEKEETT